MDIRDLNSHVLFCSELFSIGKGSMLNRVLSRDQYPMIKSA